MKLGRIALLCSLISLIGLPARADFFEDLDFALTKLGNNIEKNVDSVVSSVMKNPSEAPQSTVISKSDIIWNPPPPDLANTVGLVPYQSPGIGWQLRPGQQVMVMPRIAAKDDAPAPSKAPVRAQVASAHLPPLPGFGEAQAQSQAGSQAPAAASLSAVTPIAPAAGHAD